MRLIIRLKNFDFLILLNFDFHIIVSVAHNNLPVQLLHKHRYQG